MTHPKPRSEKYWRHVIRHADCWLWTGDTDRKGYGQIREQVNGKRKWLKAHRVSWELHYGPIPSGKKILHKCDNPPCTRPDHLFLGTIKSNADDAVNKGRIKLPGAKLTSEQRQWALEQKSKLSTKTIARTLHVACCTITRLFARTTWDKPLIVYKRL
jgi:hypothetical protein